MNGFWMDSLWWSWPAVSALGSLFTLFFWCQTIFFETLEKYKKDVPNFVYRMMLLDKKSTEEEYNKSEEDTPRTSVGKGIAIVLGAIFFLGLQLDLWINYSGGHVTLERALVVQLTLFLPFLLFNYLVAHFFQRYLNKLPVQNDAPKE